MQEEIKIALDENTAKGVYSNFAMISHSENEFITDFIFAHPPVGKVSSRVIMSPTQAKRFLAALAENLKLYEAKFGTIKEPSEKQDFRINMSVN